MPAIVSEFDVLIDQIKFTTQTNGDRLYIGPVHIGQEAATNLANLINSGSTLKIRIRKAVE